MTETFRISTVVVITRMCKFVKILNRCDSLYISILNKGNLQSLRAVLPSFWFPVCYLRAPWSSRLESMEGRGQGGESLLTHTGSGGCCRNTTAGGPHHPFCLPCSKSRSTLQPTVRPHSRGSVEHPSAGFRHKLLQRYLSFKTLKAPFSLIPSWSSL